MASTASEAEAEPAGLKLFYNYYSTGGLLWVVVTQDFGCQNRYSRKVVLMHTHPGVIEGCEFTERNQRGEKPEETTKL